MNTLPKIKQFMDQVVPVLKPNMRVTEAVDFLLRHRVTGAPVVDRRGKIIGIITETDLLRLITEGVDGEPPVDAKVSDFMTTEVVTVGPETDVYFVAGTFLSHKFRRLPVVDKGKLVGAITRFDLLRVIQSLSRIHWQKP